MMRKRTMWSGGGDDPTNGHPYVEIGGVKWATMNIGANSETDYGLYFQWGDTQGYHSRQCGSGSYQKPFSWKDYKFGNGTSNPGANGMVKYNASDGKTVLDLSDDAARLYWGSYWRMPTTEEFAALGAAVNTQWTSNYNGTSVAGLIVTDRTDSTKVLFFPAAGGVDNSTYNTEYVGNYFSSSLYSNNILVREL